MTRSETVQSALADGVLTLVLNRPDKLNSFNEEMHLALRSEIQRAHDDPAVRAVLLTGAAGDVISFRIDQRSTPAYDTSSWSPRVTYVTPNVYDLSDDLASVQNSLGWSFSTWVAGVGTSPMTWNGTQGRWLGRNTYDQLWNGTRQIFLAPDNDQVLVNWTAPRSGTVTVGGQVAKFDTTGGDGVNVSIWQNSTDVWPGSGQWQAIAYNDATGYSPSLTLSVAAGDVISFRIDQGATSAYDTTSWAPRITYQ